MKALSAHRRVLGLLFAVALCSLVSVKLISSLAQNATQENKHPWKVRKVGGKRLGVKPKTHDPSDSQERVIDDTLPAHLPIKVELKNLEVEPMLPNLEVKVTNTSGKPIYYLELHMSLPDILVMGYPICFPLEYGRGALINSEESVRPDDVPLQPGESCILRIPEKYLQGLEINLSELNLRHSDIKRIDFFFNALVFGDKTGFRGTGGDAVPHTRRSQNSNNSTRCVGEELSDVVFSNAQLTFSTDTSFETFFQPVAFVKEGNSIPRPRLQSGLCCPGTVCYWVKEAKYNCQCGEAATLTTPGCNDVEAKCSDEYQINRTCPDGRGGKYVCPEFFRQHCSTYCDRDGDNWYSTSCEGGVDCNDNDPNITPFSPQCQPSPSPSPSPTFIAGSCSPTLERRCRLIGGCWIRSKCECDENCNTPVLVDTLGDGFRLTDAENGVRFNFNGGGPEQMAWTAAGSDDAFLVLDRNGNGAVDDGTELFGNLTPQPPSEQPNGFLALAEYDKPAGGGNLDSVISSSDAVFTGLRLWQDVNHNGISEAGELHTLPSLDVTALGLDYKEAKQTDQYGNQFRYRAKAGEAKGAKVGRWAWDVFLRFAPG